MNEIMYAATMNQYGVLNVYVSVDAKDADSFKLEVERNNQQLVSTISYANLNFPAERMEHLRDTINSKRDGIPMPIWECCCALYNWTECVPLWINNCKYRRKPAAIKEVYWTCFVEDNGAIVSKFHKRIPHSDIQTKEDWKVYLEKYCLVTVVSDIYEHTITITKV